MYNRKKMIKNDNIKIYEKSDSLYYKTLTRKDIFTDAISLIYICYYLWINSNKHRRKLEDSMEII